MAPQQNRRPRLLVTNDDGIKAPGLRRLVEEIAKADFADMWVCAPNGERSSQSHAITLGRYIACEPTEVPGTMEAFAVDGTPADSVKLALHSNLLGGGNIEFDLVVSGINRGDNCGLHIIYSGTVGAAREGACKGLPGIALSVDNHMARRPEDYDLSAQMAVTVIKAALGLLPGQPAVPDPNGGEATTAAKALSGAVLNVNFPIGQGQMVQGFYLTHQSLGCVFPAFKEVQEANGPHLAEIDEHTPNSRVFRIYAGMVQEDDVEGSDGWAVRQGWVSVTPLGLRQDLPGRAGPGLHQRVESITSAAAAIVRAAAQETGMAVGGLGKA